MTGNSRRSMTTNPPLGILLGSIRVLKDYIAALTPNLWAPIARMRHLLKLLPGLRSGIMLRLPSDLVFISIVSLQPPTDPVAMIHPVVQKILASPARANTLETFEGI
jgi:hypothetical protein